MIFLNVLSALGLFCEPEHHGGPLPRQLFLPQQRLLLFVTQCLLAWLEGALGASRWWCGERGSILLVQSVLGRTCVPGPQRQKLLSDPPSQWLEISNVLGPICFPVPSSAQSIFFSYPLPPSAKGLCLGPNGYSVCYSFPSGLKLFVPQGKQGRRNQMGLVSFPQ